MIFFFTTFEYSNKATIFALFMDLIAYILSVVGLILLFLSVWFGARFVYIGLLLFVLAFFFYFFMGSKLGRRIARKDFQKKIYTDPIVAYNYVNNGHATYEEMAAKNPAFAAKYELNQFGKVTLRKK